MANSDTTEEWVWKLRDEFSGAFEKFRSEAALTAQKADSAKQHIVGLGDTFKNLKGMVLGAFGLYAGFEFFKGGLEKAHESKAALAQLNASLESTKGAAGIASAELDKWGDKLSGSSTYSKSAVTDMQALLLTFTAVGKDVFPTASQAIADMSAKMGVDLKSTTIQVGKALQDPIRGISALHRVGVNFSEAQKDVIKKLVETGQTAKAQGIILAELATEFGGSAKAAFNADPILQVKKAFGSLQKEIGLFLEHILVKLIPVLLKMIAVLKEAFHWIEEHKGLLKTLAIAISGAVIGYYAFNAAIKLQVWYMGLASASTITYALVTGGLSAALDVAGISTVALGTAMKALPILLIGAEIAVLIKQIREYKSLTELQKESMAEAQESGIKKEQRDVQTLTDKYMKLHHWTQKVAEAKAYAFERGENLRGIKEIQAKLFSDDMKEGSAEQKQLQLQLSELLGRGRALLDPKTFEKKDASAPGLPIASSEPRETRNTVINISINKLIEALNFHTANMGENADKIKEIVMQALTSAINDSQIIAGQ